MSTLTTLNNVAEKLMSGLNRYRLEVQGCDAVLDVESFTAREQFSDVYRYQIQYTSAAKDIGAQQMLRKGATLTMQTLGENLFGLTTPAQVQKVVHGIVTGFQRLSGSVDEALYQITLEPFFTLLGNQQRSWRFFLNLSVPEIVEQILREHNFKGWEFEFRLKQTYPKRAQVNQANESDRAFIERLLAEVGIFYTFTLQPDTQTEILLFGDRQSFYQFGKTLPLRNPSGMSDSAAVAVWGLSLRHQVVEKSVLAKDYNYREAHNPLLSANADMTRGEGEETTYGDVYRYQPRHLSTGDKITPESETANFWARLDHERYLVQQTRLRGYSSDVSLAPGQVLTIQDTALISSLPAVFQEPVVITAVRFTASRSSALQVRFTAIPYSETLCYRPPLKARPVVSGTLMARISSPKDNDIYAHQDKDGLYWVNFDADLDEKPLGYESMPVRLAKPYGGDTYGIHFPLIQGTEVAIAFHEGDPDRPYIAHAMHDSRHPDPVTERNNTRNVIRTPANNKLRMEDKRGEEHIKLSTEYGGKSQLNLGHLVDAQRSARGEGAELRTDDWVAVRGGKGVFISADKQPHAGEEMLSMQAVLGQLQQAQSLAEALSGAAETAKAELVDLQEQKKLLSETLSELKQAALLLSAPAGIAQATPKSLQLSAGENVISTSGKNTDFSVLKKFTVAAGERISLFAQKLGIKLFASQGKVEIQAQGDEMTLDALKDLRISSSEGKIVISAKQDILLVGSGGAYIRIGNGEVESGAPDKIIQRAAVWQKFSGQSASEMAQKWETADFAVTPQVLWPFDDTPVSAQALNVLSGDGGQQSLMTSSSGMVEKQQRVSIDALKIYLKDKE